MKVHEQEGEGCGNHTTFRHAPLLRQQSSTPLWPTVILWRHNNTRHSADSKKYQFFSRIQTTSQHILETGGDGADQDHDPEKSTLILTLHPKLLSALLVYAYSLGQRKGCVHE